MKRPELHLKFPAHPVLDRYQVDLLEALPPKEPESPVYVFPERVEDVERGAVLLRISPSRMHPWIGVFALGYASAEVVHGIYSCPSMTDLCVVSGGYAYVVDVRNPKVWRRLDAQPIVRIDVVPHPELLLFTDFKTISAWGEKGFLWQTEPLSWEGVTIREISPAGILGSGWQPWTDEEVDFCVDIHTGRHTGGVASRNPATKVISNG